MSMKADIGLLGGALASGSSSDPSTQDEEHSGHNTDDRIVMFLSVAILFGAFFKTLAQRSKYFRVLPYTVVMLFIGILFGIWNIFGFVGYLGYAFEEITNIDPHLFLLIFLPPLIFESAFSVDYHIIKREALQALVLAGPGVIISMILTAIVARYIFPYDWSWSTALMFGAMLSATDPVAVVALLRSVGASKRLGTLIEAESLFNDGTAFVFFLIWRDFQVGEERTVGQVATFLVRLSLGGCLLGLAIGIIAVIWIAKTINSPVVETAITLATAYFTFWLAESNDVGMHVSGVLAVVVLGIFLSKNRSYVSVVSHDIMHAFWQIFGYLVNTIIFFVSGLIVADRLFDESESLTGEDFGWLIVLYVFLMLIRGFTVFLLYPILCRLGYGFDYKIASVLVYGGLRGAVSLALGLIVDLNNDIPLSIRERIFFHVAGIVLLTIAINGSTTRYLLRYLGLTDYKAPERRAFRKAMGEIGERSDQSTLKLRKTKEFESANWATVSKFLPKYEKVARELAVAVVRPNSTFKFTDEEYMRFGKMHRMATINLLDVKDEEKGKAKASAEDMREEMVHRVLTSIKANFHIGYEQGKVSAHTIAILDEAAETALDLCSISQLWTLLHIDGYFKMPIGFAFLENCYHSASQKILYDRLSTAIEIMFAVRHAVCAAKHLDHFFSGLDADQHFAAIVHELEQLQGKAEHALEEAAKAFPQVLNACQTEKAARVVLKEEEKAIHHLAEEGILQERERDLMVKLVRRSEFMIETHSMHATIPRESDAIKASHLWRYLIDKHRHKILHSHRTVLKKGSRVFASCNTGCFIVIKGLVDVYSGTNALDASLRKKKANDNDKREVHEEQKEQKNSKEKSLASTSPTNEVRNVGVSGIIGVWTLCTGEPLDIEPLAHSSPVIVVHVEKKVCKSILRTIAGPYCWRLAAAEILFFRYPKRVANYTRDALDALCLKSDLQTFEEQDKAVVKAPVLILKGHARMVSSGRTYAARDLIEIRHSRRESKLLQLGGNGDVPITLTSTAQREKKSICEFAKGSLVLVLSELRISDNVKSVHKRKTSACELRRRNYCNIRRAASMDDSRIERHEGKKLENRGHHFERYSRSSSRSRRDSNHNHNNLLIDPVPSSRIGRLSISSHPRKSIVEDVEMGLTKGSDEKKPLENLN